MEISTLRGYYLHYVEISTFRGYYPHFVDIYVLCGYYPYFLEISMFCRYYLHFMDIIYIDHITSYLARNACHGLHSFVLVVNVIYSDHIMRYLVHNFGPIFHIYSFSESDWCTEETFNAIGWDNQQCILARILPQFWFRMIKSQHIWFIKVQQKYCISLTTSFKFILWYQ